MPLIKRASASRRNHGDLLEHGEPSTSPSSPSSEDVIAVHAAVPPNEVQSTRKIDENPFAYFITPPSTPGLLGSRSEDGVRGTNDDNDDDDESLFTFDDLQAGAGIVSEPTSYSRSLSPFGRKRSRAKMSRPASSTTLSLPLPFPSFSPTAAAAAASSITEGRGHPRNLQKLRHWVLHVPDAPSASDAYLSAQSTAAPLSRSPPAPYLRPQRADLEDVPAFATLGTITEEDEDVPAEEMDENDLVDDDDELDFSEDEDEDEDSDIDLDEDDDDDDELELNLSHSRGRARHTNRSYAPIVRFGNTGRTSRATRRMRGRVWRLPSEELWTIWEEVEED